MDSILNAAKMLEELTVNTDVNSDLNISVSTPLGDALKKITIPNALTKAKNMVRGVKAAKVAPPAWKKNKSKIRLTQNELELRPSSRQLDIVTKRKNREGMKLLCKLGDVKALCAKMKEDIQDSIKPRTNGRPITKHIRHILEQVASKIDNPETHELACAQIFAARDVVNKKEIALQSGVQCTPGLLEQMHTLRELTVLAERDDVVITALKVLTVPC